MKKSTLIISTVLLAMGLMAFGFSNWDGTNTGLEIQKCIKEVETTSELANLKKENEKLDLLYDVDSRFIATITKKDLHNAQSIIDILPENATVASAKYKYARVSILEDVTETESEQGLNEILNDAQKKLLQTVDYSTNIYIRADFKVGNEFFETPQNDYLTYFITVVPEKEAEFSKGQDALLDYLRENSKEETSIITSDKLKAGKVHFTITKEEEIANVYLSSTSGYESVDKALIKLIKNMPSWNAATNSKGEKVDQELIFFFGLKGC